MLSLRSVFISFGDVPNTSLYNAYKDSHIIMNIITNSEQHNKL